ncbi:MAG TPA: 2-C-methyl-D-erythritol 4-phosphate cytidylyltransferase [Chlamydiales bacterium]|nr:2-C-methyl-D-erythritol 4-phosphate cytidylyltransferase [Chlamydiales bacterium]
MNAAILLMGGIGSRFQSTTPKQFHFLSGKKIYLHTLETILNSQLFQEVILVCPKDWEERVKNETSHLQVLVVTGGATRQESSYLGLLHCKNAEIVLIHDAVRPFVSLEILQENIAAAKKYQAVDTCIPSADTIVHSERGDTITAIPNRAHYLRGQTPQTFSYPLILAAHKEAIKKGITNASDDCRLVMEMGHKVHIVLGSDENIKITTELDLFIAEQIFRLKKTPLPNLTASLQGKIYAVIGGTGGIGQEICSHLLKEGAQAIPLSRSTPLPLDLRNKESIRKAFEKIGPVDGLINAAGLLKVKPFQMLHLEEIQELIEVNLLGLLYACNIAKIKEGGHIINMASSSFFKGRRDYGVYSGAKAAIVNFTQALAEERMDLRVNVLVPQRTDTPMRRNNFPKETGELLDPKVVAQKTIDLLKSQEITGSIIEIKNQISQ